MLHLLMFVHSALSAGTYLAGKRALAEVSPVELALVRFVLATLVHGALLLRLRPPLARRDLLLGARPRRGEPRRGVVEHPALLTALLSGALYGETLTAPFVGGGVMVVAG